MDSVMVILCVLAIVSAEECNRYESASKCIEDYDVGRFNAALGKPTRQSSTWNDYSSDRAVDGKTNPFIQSGKSCSQTRDSAITWWAVDLQEIYEIYSVTLSSRGDSNSKKLQSFEIRGYKELSKAISTEVLDTAQFTTCAFLKQGSPIPESTTKKFTCSTQTFARHVVIYKNNDESLDLCEVQVEAACGKEKFGKNCAKNCIPNCAYCMSSTGVCVKCAKGYILDKEGLLKCTSIKSDNDKNNTTSNSTKVTDKLANSGQDQVTNNSGYADKILLGLVPIFVIVAGVIAVTVHKKMRQRKVKKPQESGVDAGKARKSLASVPPSAKSGSGSANQSQQESETEEDWGEYSEQDWSEEDEAA